MFKYLFILLCVAAIAASAYIIDAKSPDFSPGERISARSYKFYALGTIEGATPDVQLRPEIRGRVVKTPVVIGQLVEPGDVLLSLDDQRQKQLVSASQASLALAQAQLERLINGAKPSERAEAKALLDAKVARLEQAKRTWMRVQKLHQEAAVTQQEAENEQSSVQALTAEVAAAQARVEQLESPPRADEIREAQARVAAAQAELELAVLESEQCRLKAPARGRILDVDVEPGEIIGPDSFTPAIVLADVERMRVRAYVEEIDAPRLRIGMPAEITADGLPDHVALGRIEFISPRMTPKQLTSEQPNELYDTKVREVLIDVLDPSRLIVGLRVDVILYEEDSTEGMEIGSRLMSARDGASR
ncbi:MAG: HlyD family secretion protein [Pirellulales bacterium]|nr:HlyD family secretion protein [Pirellulales bacterium]